MKFDIRPIDITDKEFQTILLEIIAKIKEKVIFFRGIEIDGFISRSLKYYYHNIDELKSNQILPNAKKLLFFQTRLHEEIGHLITGLWGCLNKEKKI